MAKHDPLENWLLRNPAPEITLDLAEIAHILGHPLPKAARRPQWWSSPDSRGGRPGRAQAWHKAGYDAFPAAADNRVTFRRRMVSYTLNEDSSTTFIVPE